MFNGRIDDICFNIKGQRDIVKSKLWEDILFGLEGLFLEVYTKENDSTFMLYVCKCVLLIGS